MLMKFCTFLLFLFHLHLTAELVVHEWGSINIVTGQEKVVVGNISDDQSDLPHFVEVWTTQAQVRPMVIEKPILYFYTDKQQSVSVTAKYPNGIFTQWWPKPIRFSPRALSQNGLRPKKAGNYNGWSH